MSRACFFIYCAQQMWRHTVLAVAVAMLLASAPAHADECPTALAPLFAAFQAFGGGGVAPFTLVTNQHGGAPATYTTTTATGLLRFDAVAPDTPFLYSDNAPQVLSTRVASETGQPVEAGVPAALGLLTLYADGQVVHHTEARAMEVNGTCVGTVLSGYDGVNTMLILSIGQPRAEEALPDPNVVHASITEFDGNVGIGTTNPVSALDVRGRLTLDPGVGNPVVLYTAASGGEQNRYLELINSPDYRSASGLKAGGLLISDDYYFANPGKNDLVVKGNVGIGASPSSSRLTIEGQNALTINGYEPYLTLSDLNSPDLFSHRIQSAHGDLAFFQGFRPSGQLAFEWSPKMTIKDTGDVGIGTAYPLHKLHVAGSFLRVDGAGNEQVYLGGDGYGGDVQLGSSNPNIANVALWNSTTNRHMNLFVGALTITGGADFAEHFDVNAAPESGAAAVTKVEPGMVVSIDPAHPGKLQLSTQAYDHQVAGIISGAGGVKPGMMMSQAGTLADGTYPVALSGRVYGWADAANGPINPGDLLTTSHTPGHAMKVTDREKAQGAIMGKAMTGLQAGKGLVLVLVTLQ